MPEPLAKFEPGLTSLGGVDLVRYQWSAGAWSTYTMPTVGVGSQTELLSLLAVQMGVDLALGVTWTWTIDHATKRASLTHDAGAAQFLVEWLNTAARDYCGYDANHPDSVQPYTAANAPEGIWYPSRGLVSADIDTMSGVQLAWHDADAVRSSAGDGDPNDTWTLVTRVDNSADDWAEYQECWDFMRHYAAEGRVFSWFEDYADAYTAAHLLYMDGRQKQIRYSRLGPRTRRYFDMPLFASEVEALS